PPWLTTTLASVTEKAAYRFVASHARRTVTELSDPTDGGSSTIAGAPVHSPSAPSVATAACIGASNTGRGGAPLLSCRMRCASCARALSSCATVGRRATSGAYVLGSGNTPRAAASANAGQ